MNKVKRGSIVFVILCLVLASSTVAFAKDGYSDVKKGSWYYSNIMNLTGSHTSEGQVLSGYGDGTFRPNNTITIAEFVKTTTMMTMAGKGDWEKPTENKDHWAAKYFHNAEKVGLVDKGEYPRGTWNTPITRQQMAKLSVRTLIGDGKHYGMIEDQEFLDAVIKKIPDLDKVPKEYREYVVQAYGRGLIGGYKGGVFKGDGNATRAEACTIAWRTWGLASRLTVKIPIGDYYGYHIHGYQPKN